MVILQKGLGISGYRDRFGLAIPAQGKQHVVGRDMYIHPLCFLRMLHVLCFFFFSLSLSILYNIIYICSYTCLLYPHTSPFPSCVRLRPCLPIFLHFPAHPSMTTSPLSQTTVRRRCGEKQCHLSAKVFHSLQQRFVAHFLFLFLDVSVIWPRSQALHPGIRAEPMVTAVALSCIAACRWLLGRASGNRIGGSIRAGPNRALLAVIDSLLLLKVMCRCFSSFPFFSLKRLWPPSVPA